MKWDIQINHFSPRNQINRETFFTDAKVVKKIDSHRYVVDLVWGRGTGTSTHYYARRQLMILNTKIKTLSLSSRGGTVQAKNKQEIIDSLCCFVEENKLLLESFDELSQYPTHQIIKLRISP